MEYKHNSMRLSCKCRPAVVEFRVTTGIPELNINFGHPVFHLYILKTHLVEIEYYPSKISSNKVCLPFVLVIRIILPAQILVS